IVPAIEIDRPSVEPGGVLVATGRGCSPGGLVDLTISGEPAGQVLADEDGRFVASLDTPDLVVGHYELTAACGPVLTVPFDVVLVSQVDPGTSSLLVMLFILLLAMAYCVNRIFSVGGRHAP
ncbi:MAG: hypothetical protein ACRD12_24510, partial [Acidimicrobiales bacterium]